MPRFFDASRNNGVENGETDEGENDIQVEDEIGDSGEDGDGDEKAEIGLARFVVTALTDEEFLETDRQDEQIGTGKNEADAYQKISNDINGRVDGCGILDDKIGDEKRDKLGRGRQGRGRAGGELGVGMRSWDFGFT